MARREAIELETVPIMMSSLHGGPQRARTGARHRKPFDKATRQRFLDALVLTCNIKMSAAHAGIDHSTAYKMRTRDPVFAGQWREALDMGLERLEMQIVEHGGAGLPLDDADPERALTDGAPPFDFGKALQALQFHAKFRLREARRSNVPPPSAADTDAAITALLAKLKGRATVERARLAVLPALPAPDDELSDDGADDA